MTSTYKLLAKDMAWSIFQRNIYPVMIAESKLIQWQSASITGQTYNGIAIDEEHPNPNISDIASAMEYIQNAGFTPTTMIMSREAYNAYSMLVKQKEEI